MKISGVNGRNNISGVNIRAERERLGLSQEQLAARLQVLGADITQKTVSRIETGVRLVPDYELPLFSEALSVSVLRLLGQ